MSSAVIDVLIYEWWLFSDYPSHVKYISMLFFDFGPNSRGICSYTL